MKTDHAFISITYWFLRTLIGFPVKFFFIKSVSGIENIPRNQAAILAFNHQSFFDFICFASISPRNVHFLSAEKFFEHPVWRIIMFLTGQIKVERQTHDKSLVHQSVKRHISRRMLVGIFPEGTRSPYRDRMLKAFNGVSKYALEHEVPIVPVGIKGTFDVMSKHDRFPKISKIVSIEVGKPLHFREHHHKHSDKVICTYVTECVIRELEKLSDKKYEHYETEQK